VDASTPDSGSGGIGGGDAGGGIGDAGNADASDDGTFGGSGCDCDVTGARRGAGGGPALGVLVALGVVVARRRRRTG
jgi:MYXO-CTERM domain-containing protein